jgi:hypothetical protein
MGTHPASAAKQACQQAFHGQICIELGPMQPYALRRNFNVSQLLGPGTGQALCQLGWKRKKSAVFKTNHDAFFFGCHNEQTRHAKPWPAQPALWSGPLQPEPIRI